VSEKSHQRLCSISVCRIQTVEIWIDGSIAHFCKNYLETKEIYIHLVLTVAPMLRLAGGVMAPMLRLTNDILAPIGSALLARLTTERGQFAAQTNIRRNPICA
jgi:hypothetical protein